MASSVKRFFRLIPLAIVAGILAFAPAASATPWENSYEKAFQPAAVGHNPVNAYLMMLACYYNYENRIMTANFEEFKKKYVELFTPWGMTEFDFINIRRRSADTQVVVMSNRVMTLVVFRGSEASSGASFKPVKFVYDWLLTDFNFFKHKVPEWGDDVKVHRGFYNAVDVAYPELKRLCEKHLGVSGRRLWITGHSLGAGLVPIAALRLARDGIPVHGLTSFAGPRVGNEAFATIFAARFPQFQRWVNDKDLVTMVPYAWMKFRHLSKPNNLYADGKAVIGDAPFKGLGKVSAHAPGIYLQRLYAQVPPELRESVPMPPAFESGKGPEDADLEREFSKKRISILDFGRPDPED
ncbi:MAG TPA: lipase family protein [Candidatus Ozemobacteraceae bacterium]